jgi:Protein of unknown function (DUF3137)
MFLYFSQSGGGFFGGLKNPPLHSLQKELRKFILFQAFGFFGQFEVLENQKPPPSKIQSIRIFPGFDNYTCDDYLKGNYHNNAVAFAEIHLSAETGASKNRKKRTVFQGLVIFLDGASGLRGQTIVVSQQDRLMQKMRDLFSDQKLPRVVLEDIQFEDRLEVYSSDQIEARYILTPVFMEAFLSLAARFRNTDGKPATASFASGQIALAIPHSGDLFPVPALRKPDYPGAFRQLLHDLTATFAVIDTLRANRNLKLEAAGAGVADAPTVATERSL